MMVRLVILICFSVGMVRSDLLAQIKRDSILKIWNNKSLTDSIRSKAMYELTWSYLFTNPDSAYHFATLQYKYGKKFKSILSESHGLNVMGLSWLVRADYDSAIHYLNIQLKTDKMYGDLQGEASVYNNLAIAYKQKGDFHKSILLLGESLKIQEEVGDERGAAGTLANIATIYRMQHNYNDALNYYKRCLKLVEHSGESDIVPSVYNNIGNIYRDLKQYSKAIANISNGLQLSSRLGNISNMASANSNLGNVYVEMNQLSKALEYYEKSLKLFRDSGKKNDEAVTMYCLADVYLRLIDSLPIQKNKYLEYAKKYIHQSSIMINDFGTYSSKGELAKIKWHFYKLTNNPSAALESYETYIAISDSMKNADNAKALISQQYKYEYGKKTAADSVRVLEEKRVAAIELKRERFFRYYLYIGLFVTGIFGFFMFNRFRIIKKQKLLIEKQKLAVEEQKAIIDEKQKEILDSIRYAKRIQQALLPNNKYMEKSLRKKSK